MKNYVPYFDDSFIGLTGTETQIAEPRKRTEPITRSSRIREQIRMSTQ